MATPNTITIEEFKDALSRYPETIKKFSDAAKPSENTLEQLDQFRYVDAPAEFSKQTGNVLKAEHIQKLTAWKIRHGKFRPSLTNLVASNTDEDVAKATKAAFSHYASSPDDIAGTLNLLSKPLKGVGPATASLYLAVHDPTKIIFFSDEAYKWLVSDAKLKYDVKEYVALHEAAQNFMEKLSVAPIEVEKVAFVLVKENVPEKKTAEPRESTGRARGRPVGTTKASKGPQEATRRSERQSTASDSADGKMPGGRAKRTPVKVTKVGTGKTVTTGNNKPRGRPPGEKTGQDSEKKRGRPPGQKSEQESSDFTSGRKRGRPPGSTKEKSAKKAKV